MNPDPIVVPPSLDLQHWVEDFIYRYRRKLFPVVSAGHLEGFVDTRALAKIPRREWEQHTVAEVMRHDLNDLTISPEADALEALRKMESSGVNRLLVTEGDHLAGIITFKDLMRFLNLRLELEGRDGNGAPRTARSSRLEQQEFTEEP